MSRIIFFLNDRLTFQTQKEFTIGFNNDLRLWHAFLPFHQLLYIAYRFLNTSFYIVWWLESIVEKIICFFVTCKDLRHKHQFNLRPEHILLKAHVNSYSVCIFLGSKLYATRSKTSYVSIYTFVWFNQVFELVRKLDRIELRMCTQHNIHTINEDKNIMKRYDDFICSELFTYYHPVCKLRWVSCNAYASISIVRPFYMSQSTEAASSTHVDTYRVFVAHSIRYTASLPLHYGTRVKATLCDHYYQPFITLSSCPGFGSIARMSLCTSDSASR